MKRASKNFYIGTAGWSLPHDSRSHFPLLGSHLERYAKVFNSVEINSSFYRIHRTDTYAKWAAMVPRDFRFSVKLFKRLTHEKRLQVSVAELQEALAGPLELEEKLGVLLVQLPPSVEFQRDFTDKFFDQLRSLYLGLVALEPRHSSWISVEAKALFLKYQLSLVAADPQNLRVDEEKLYELAGFYYARLHGSPLIYKSKYPQEALEGYASSYNELTCGGPVWCIFDNTTYGYATTDALELTRLVTSKIKVERKPKDIENSLTE